MRHPEANRSDRYIDYTYDNQTHAMLWNGSSQSMVDLHPTQFTQFDCSQAMGIGGGQQVGFLYNYSSQSLPTVSHAVLWNGTAASAVDLNPAGFVRSWANATDGIHQVGMASTSLQLGRIDPILWTSTAASAVDLAPTLLPEIGAAQVLGVSGNQEVGLAVYSGSSLPADHALLWTGTAASAVDLTPSSFSDSEALATNGTIQVGYGIDWAHNLDNAKPHALAWSGSAESVVDLQALLPADFTESKALSVDAAGNVYGYALGPALPGSLASGYYAVEWEAVPEPGGLALLMVSMPAIVRRQRPPLRR